MIKKIIIAEKAGFCFGVKRAIEIALDTSIHTSKKIYTLGPLIHNNDAINYLKTNNIFEADENELDKLNPGDFIIIRSHGISPFVTQTLKQHGLNIIDATCPFVKKIHELVKKHYNLGYKIIIVGDENHPEVIGINGSCNNEAIITKDGSNIKDGLEKVCIVSQTTEKVENLKKVVDIVSKTAKEILTFNTICNATKERQKSAEELAKQVDLMIVIGGKNSSNSRKLFEICSQNCKNTIFIENCLELDLSKIIDDNIKAIGITAGASTPDWVIENVILKIQNNVEECTL